MSSSDGEGKDSHLVTIVEHMAVTRPGLAVHRHAMHAAVLATGQVQLGQEPGHVRTLRQLDRRPAPCLSRQDRTKARKELYMYTYGQAESSSPPVQALNSPTIILKNVGRGKMIALRSTDRVAGR